MELLLFTLIMIIPSSVAETENVYGRNGSSLIFVCPHRKNGTKNVLWNFVNSVGQFFALSEGDALTNTPLKERLEIVGDQSAGEYNLRLSDLQETDEGTYTCGLAGSTQRKKYYFELLAAPSDLVLYNVVGNNIIGTEGHSLTINCTAIGGKPPPDMRLELDSQVITGPQSVKYIIPVLQRSNDKQLVKCQATSDALESTLEKTASMYLYLKPSKPVFNQDPPRTNDTQPLILSCTSTGSRPSGALIHWKINSNPVTDGIVQQNTTDPSTDTYTVVSTLTYSVDRSYNGQPITCGVSHQTLNQALEVTKTISVQYAPDLTVSNKTHTQADLTRTIQCTADGNPTSYMYCEWEHKSTYGIFIRELNGSNNGILTLPSVAESDRYQDSGEYICTVSNGIGDKDGNIKKTGYGYMTVNAQPRYTEDNNDISTQYGELGKSSDLHVYVYSVPKYTHVNWYKGNTSLSKNNKYDMTENLAAVRISFHGVEVELDGFQLTLTISNLVEGDFTSYKLRLNNGYGKRVEYSVSLESARAPQAPQNFSITYSSVYSISFEWDPGLDWGYDQTFHVEYRVTGSTSWSVEEIPKTQQTGRQTFTLSGLSAGTSYELRLYAENKFNKSLPAYIERIVTVQDNQASSSALVGGVVGGLVSIVVILVVIILVVVYLRKKGAVSRQNVKYKSKDEVIFQNHFNSDMYEEIDGETNKDDNQSTTNNDRSAKTYEPLGMQDKPNLYAELSDQENDPPSTTHDDSTTNTYESSGVTDNPHLYTELSDQEGQARYYSTAQQYESLGAKDKPNVYEDLQNKKEKEYVNMTLN